MMLLHSSSLEQAPSFTELVTPWATPGLTLVGVLVIGAVTLHNRRKGATETRIPDVNEIWIQQAKDARALDLERRARRRLENYADELLRVFRAYVRRVIRGGSPELTKAEQKYHDDSPPTIEIDIPQG